MARKRIRLPWSRRKARGAASVADASFFELPAGGTPRPDSPEVSIFTPEEEAESHKRWKRAARHARFTGPVSDVERLGVGLSAAALAALAASQMEADADEELDEQEEARRHGPAGADPEDAAEVFVALKSAAIDGGASKPAVSAKPAGAATNAFLDTDEDGVFSNPISSRSDQGGFGARRAAPRGSGAPLESRMGAAERAEVTVLRKVDQVPGEARAPLAGDAASAAVRGGSAEAQAAVAVAIAVALAAEASEARENRPSVEAKAANGPAKANQAQAPADAAASAKAKDAPPVAEAKADGRQASAVEAAVRDKAGDAPSPAAVAKAGAEAGRGAAAEAPARAKANDAASGAAEAGSDRKGGAAAEAPVEAKAKDVAPTAEADGGLGQKAAKPLAQKAAEVVVLESKATGPEKGAADANGATKAKETQVVVEAKAEAVRQTVETPEQTAAKALPDVAGTNTVHVNGSVPTSAAGETKATNAAADKAAPAVPHASTEATAQAAKAAAVAVAPPAADKAAPHAPAETAAQGNKAEAASTTAIATEKAAKAGTTTAAAADQAAPHATSEAAAQGNKAEATTATSAEKAGAAHAPAETAAQADKASVLPVAADKAAPAAEHGPAETAAAQAGKASVLPAAAADKAAPHATVEAAKMAAAAKADAVPQPTTAKDAGITAAAKADPGHATAAAPGQAKDAGLPAAAKAEAARDHAEAPGQAKVAEVLPVATEAKTGQAPSAAAEVPTAQTKAKDALAVGTKPDPSQAPAEAPSQTASKDVPSAADAAGKAGAGPGHGAPEVLPVADSKQAAAPVKAAETTPTVVEAKGAHNLDGHPEVPAISVKAKDVVAAAAVAPDAAQHQAEPPAAAKDAPAAIVATAVPEVAKAGQAAQVADIGAPKAEHAFPAAEQPSQAKQADPPPAQAHDSPQHDSAQHGDAASGAVPAVSAAAGAIDLHVADLWPGTGQGSGQSQSNVALPEKAAQPVLHDATGSTAANGEHDTADAAPADGGSSGGAVAASPSPGTSEKTAAGTPSTAAPDGASPTQKVAAAEPAGAETHVAVTKPPGETADSVVLDTVTKLEVTNGHGLTEAEALALLSAANSKATDMGHDGLTAGDILVQGHSGLDVSALDAAWHQHFAHEALLL